MTPCGHEFKVTQGPVGNVGDLARQWQGLEQHAHPSVFLSWMWIGHWLATYRPDADVIRVFRDTELVGLGLVVLRCERRHGFVRSRSLRLHQTGRPGEDQVWIEYNGFLVRAGLEDDVISAIAAHLGSNNGWDELVLSGVNPAQVRQYASATGLMTHLRWEAPCYGVDLERIRMDGTAYLDSLSRNTRHQIARSLRLYQDNGGLSLHRPAGVEEAVALFDAIGPQHIERWGDHKQGSGFQNPEFVRFHRSLIRACWPDGGVELLTLRAGTETIATLYNLCFEGTVYFYLGAVKPEPDNRLKPGLVAHSLAIQQYLERGFAFYDFMGGAERYKASLGREHQHLVQVALQRPRVQFRIERLLRDIKNRFMAPVGAFHGL
nr:GNAT family N-acetyltransferase [uncultured Marinobacter sp.]